MLAVGQDASRFLLEAEQEFLNRSVVPASDVRGTDQISFSEFELPSLQSRTAVRIEGTQLPEQAIDDFPLQGPEDNDASLADNGGGIEMTYGEIVQHPHPFSAMALGSAGPPW